MGCTGRLFNIQRCSVYDGPGIRTTVFFKGCNLRCKWCHNPESLHKQQELEFNGEKCIGCNACETQCSESVHTFNEIHQLNREKCKQCFRCVETCYAKALVQVGKDLTVEELFEQIRDDIPYFERSKGGVTLSGGECLLQHDFVYDLLKKLKEEGIHTAIDTAGNVPFWIFEKIIPYVDAFLYDVKAADSKIHESVTGVDNALIMSNLRKLKEQGCKIYVRIPYIPTLNDKEMPGIAQVLSEIGIETVEVLPYHRLGEGKYEALGYGQQEGTIPIPDTSEMEQVKCIFEVYNIKVS